MTTDTIRVSKKRTMLLGAAAVLLIVTAALAVPTEGARVLTLAERVAARQAVEEVTWRHRLWPRENPQPKPLPAAPDHRGWTSTRIVLIPDSNGSSAFAMTVPGLASALAIACPGVGEATSMSPGRIAP